MKIIPACCMILPMLMPMTSQADDSQPYTETTNIKPKAFFRDDVLWQSIDIPVCWETINPSQSSQRDLVQTAVGNAWGASDTSLVNFTYWGQCPTYNPFSLYDGIRVTIDNSVTTPRSVLGTEGRGIIRGSMLLSFTLNVPAPASNDPRNISIAQRCAEKGVNLNGCIAFTAVHEFGHVLGLAHEQNRYDDPLTGGCHENDPETTGITYFPNNFHLWGNTYFTDYDPASVMNYCKPNYFAGGSLSLTDKIAVKAYYGRIPTYTVETGILDIPRIIYQGAPYKVTLENINNRFVLTSGTQTDNSRANQSSVSTTFSNSIVTLPLIRVISGGHVTQLSLATLRQDSDGKFTVTSFTPRHPDTIVNNAARLPTTNVTTLPTR